MKPKNAWSPPSHCPEYDTSLHPIGNTSSNLSKTALLLRKLGIIYFVISFILVLAASYFAPYTAWNSAKPFFAALVGIPSVPLLLTLVASCLLPKVTRLHCHNCNYTTTYHKNRPSPANVKLNPTKGKSPKVDTSVSPKKFKSTLSRNDSIKLK